MIIVSPLYQQMAVQADGLAPDGAKPSAGTVVT